jgi:hypothetical protein
VIKKLVLSLMDKPQRIVHLVIECLAKARELNKYPLDRRSKERLAELVKKTSQNQKKLQSFADRHKTNGKIDPKTLDRSLDLMLKAADDISRELDKLLAKAKGQS